MIGTILTDIAEGFGSFAPAFAGALLETFIALFFTSASEGGAISGLTPLGEISIVFMVIGMVYWAMPKVCGWFKATWKKRSERKAEAAKK